MSFGRTRSRRVEPARGGSLPIRTPACHNSWGPSSLRQGRRGDKSRAPKSNSELPRLGLALHAKHRERTSCDSSHNSTAGKKVARPPPFPFSFSLSFFFGRLEFQHCQSPPNVAIHTVFESVANVRTNPRLRPSCRECSKRRRNRGLCDSSRHNRQWRGQGEQRPGCHNGRA